MLQLKHVLPVCDRCSLAVISQLVTPLGLYEITTSRQLALLQSRQSCFLQKSTAELDHTQNTYFRFIVSPSQDSVLSVASRQSICPVPSIYWKSNSRIET